MSLSGKTKLRILGLGILMCGAFAGSFMLTSQIDSAFPLVPATIQIQASFTPQVFNRETIEGYTLANESELILRARTTSGASEITEEKIYYVRAGYWNVTRTGIDYIYKPDHPILVYTVRGKLTGLRSGHGFSIPMTGTPPTPIPPEAVTIAYDAVTGHQIVYMGRFIADINAEVSQQSHAEFIITLAAYARSHGAELPPPPLEVTADVTPKVEATALPLPTAAP